MKNLLLALFFSVISMTAIAETTYNSDGSYSQTNSNGNGGSTTYNSNGTYSQTQPNGNGGSTTYNSDGSFSTSSRY